MPWVCTHTGNLRISGSDGSDLRVGFLEANVNGRWGAVCGTYASSTSSYYWANNANANANAQVACRQMGLPWHGATAYTGSYLCVGGWGCGMEDVCWGWMEIG